MLASINPLAYIARAANPMATADNNPLAALGGAGVLRFIGNEAGDNPFAGDAIKVAGALTAEELVPGGVLGAAITAEGSLDAMIPFSAKARIELSTDMAQPSPALAGYVELLNKNKDAISALESNVDMKQFEQPENALAFLRSLKADEFVFAAQAGEKTILWKGTEAQLPAGIADVVRGTDALFGALA